MQQQSSVGANFYVFYETLPNEEQEVFLQQLQKKHPEFFVCNEENTNQIDSRSDENKERTIKIHDAYRDDLRKRQLSNTENYDKTVLTLSSSGLALSLTAIKFAIPLATANYVCLIQISWWLFCITIIIAIVAYWVGNKALDVQLKIAEDYYAKGIEEAYSRKNRYSDVNDWLNIIAGVAFMIATACIISFVTFNIN